VNLAARLADARYVMKLDAHCAVADGFDAALIAAGDELGPDVTQIPAQKNLHAFDWRCRSCGHRTYQGPTPQQCASCGARVAFEQVMVWQPRSGTTTSFWRFDDDLKFQYWNDYKRRPEAQGEIVDVMTSLGACFFMARDRFLAIGGLDTGHGGWGQFGVEIACASWLTGGRHVVNRRTWFAHLFRTQQGFGFPYPLPGSDQERAREYSRRLWFENRRPGQVLPLSWLIEKFAPLPGWHVPAGAAALERVTQAGQAFLQGRGVAA
jgi:ribosomal protein L37E